MFYLFYFVTVGQVQTFQNAKLTIKNVKQRTDVLLNRKFTQTQFTQCFATKFSFELTPGRLTQFFLSKYM